MNRRCIIAGLRRLLGLTLAGNQLNEKPADCQTSSPYRFETTPPTWLRPTGASLRVVSMSWHFFSEVTRLSPLNQLVLPCCNLETLE
jgi:hypothetical protein